MHTTKKSVVINFNSYGSAMRPAKVSYSLSDFDKAAKIYGWGVGRRPEEIVSHMGDEVPLIEVFIDALVPTRVSYQ